MKSMKTALCICITLLATAGFAIQYSGPQGSAQPGQAPQSQGSMHQDQSQPSSAQPGQAQPAQPGQQSPQQQAGRPSIDDQVKMLTQELNLTPEQQGRMKNVLEDQHQQAMTIINDASLAREDKVQKIRSLRETTISKARSMLNEDQKKKLDVMLQESDHMRQQQGQSGSPSGTQPGSTPSTSSPSSSTPGSTPPATTRPPR